MQIRRMPYRPSVWIVRDVQGRWFSACKAPTVLRYIFSCQRGSMVEHRPCNPVVMGSIPIAGSMFARTPSNGGVFMWGPVAGNRTREGATARWAVAGRAARRGPGAPPQSARRFPSLAPGSCPRQRRRCLLGPNSRDEQQNLNDCTLIVVIKNDRCYGT